MMDYRAELQILLDDENMSFETWISRYPIQECPGLILEYKNFMQKYAIENDDFETVEELQELDKFADYIENLAIDKLAERQEKFNKAEILIQKLKVLIESVSQNKSKKIAISDELLDDLRDIVKYMRSQGLYDEENWKILQHLL